MSMEVSGLRQLRDNLERLKDKAPEVMEEILIGEGVYAVGQARKIVTNAGVVNTGAYRYNFHTGTKTRPAYSSARMHDGSKPRKQGKTWIIDVYNNLDYAAFWRWASAPTLSPDTGRGKPLSMSRAFPGECMWDRMAAMWRGSGLSGQPCAALK